MKKCNKKFIFNPCPFKTILILIAVIVFFIVPTKTISASPLPLINIPLDSWVYPAISRFETFQAFEGNSIALNTTPLTRFEVASLVDTALSNLQKGKIEFKGADLLLMDKLVKEFQKELSDLDLDNLTPESTFKIEPYFTQEMDLFYPENINLEKLNLLSELGVKISATISENSALYLDAFAHTNFDWVSNIQEGEIPFRVQIKQAYVNLNLPSFKIAISDNVSFLPDNMEISDFYLLVGRDNMRWGPGYQGSLTLSDNSAAFDMFKYSGTIDLNNSGESLGKINFTKFYSLLDSLEEQNRYFLGQRLEYKPIPALTLGLSETVIISEDSSILFYNPIPFIPPYYATWWIAGMFEPQEVNCNVALDAEINLTQKIKLYGEWMADDFIFHPDVNPYPNRTGFLAGAYFADPLGSGNTDFRIEYTHINNYVYFPRHSWQDYLYQGEYIGHSLGPDADQLYLELTHYLSDRLNLSLSYNQERHGEGQIGIPLLSDPVIANENIFLSGIIEKQQAYQAKLSYTISPRWEFSVGAIWENIKNKDNNIGVDEKNTYLQMELDYQF
ncbi:MAG: capsule assembly Wzi family protein [Actinomycetia bacterium]|nr:capsule assembly Wzi family protein [Actinomycetes bacterium]